MADIELIVKIDANVYTRLFDNGIQDNEITTDDICEMARALRLGKPLPHDTPIKTVTNVKEAEEYQISESEEPVETLWYGIPPTIIEADEESEGNE